MALTSMHSCDSTWTAPRRPSASSTYSSRCTMPACNWSCPLRRFCAMWLSARSTEPSVSAVELATLLHLLLQSLLELTPARLPVVDEELNGVQ
eukprot:scaffold79482_cov69-Phaeocystis_antarctica.AAC.3